MNLGHGRFQRIQLHPLVEREDFQIATVLIPSSRNDRIILTAISPRLATSTLENIKPPTQS